MAELRDTMADLITRLRRMIGDRAGDGETWHDTDLQEALDSHRRDLYRVGLHAFPQHSGTAIDYLEYRSEHGDWERTDGGSAIFVLEDWAGNNSGTANWSADYQRGIVTFGANQSGTAYYLTGRIYDLAGAAADVLEEWNALEPAKCLVDAQGNEYFDTTRQTARMRLIDRYRSRQWAGMADMVRSDAR